MWPAWPCARGPARVGCGRDREPALRPPGLSAVVSASHAIAAGDGDLFVAGGVESMSRAPLAACGQAGNGLAARNRVGRDTRVALPEPAGMEELIPLESMGETGENVAERYGVSREQDEFALRSPQRLAEAGLFDDELVPSETPFATSIRVPTRAPRSSRR